MDENPTTVFACHQKRIPKAYIQPTEEVRFGLDKQGSLYFPSKHHPRKGKLTLNRQQKRYVMFKTTKKEEEEEEEEGHIAGIRMHYTPEHCNL